MQIESRVKELKYRLESVKNRIRKLAIDCQRDPQSIRLVAVSKTMSTKRVKEAIDAGVEILGENYIQEAREKIDSLSSYPVSWHFIGHLQTNKAKYAVRLFDLIHSVDSLKLAVELNKQAKKIDKVQDILIQINVGQEVSKSGASPKEAFDLVKNIGRLENLCLRGLMTMPPFFNAPQKVRPYFSSLCDLRDRIKAVMPTSVPANELSMGMTNDFEVAIEEGATLLRIGTAIFGERN
ncbi:MAG: YggS family pyridoxal phosphate-dependent enzyme [Desulfobacterales bacterium]